MFARSIVSRLAPLAFAMLATGQASPPPLIHVPLILPQTPQTAYPLTCRGGSNMMLVASFPAPFGAGAYVTLQFNRGTGPAANGVPAGSCTWSDRAMLPSEPALLCYNSTSRIVASAYAGGGRLEGPQPDEQLLGLPQGGLGLFQVYADTGHQCLRIVKFGP